MVEALLPLGGGRRRAGDPQERELELALRPFEIASLAAVGR